MIPCTVKRVPEFSRAVDEEDDFNNLSEKYSHSIMSISPNIKQNLINKGFLDTKYLFVGVGSIPCAFLESHILGTDSGEIIAALFTGFESVTTNSLSQLNMNDRSCFIYRLKQMPGALFCICRLNFREEMWHDWTGNLLSLIDPRETHVVILDCQSTTNFKGIHEDGVPFLRSLRSSIIDSDLYIGYPVSLEQPNLVEGLSAQVLTSCHLRNIPASMFVLYQESSYYVDTVNVRAFSPLLTLYPFNNVPLQTKENIAAVLSARLCCSENSSAIYT